MQKKEKSIIDTHFEVYIVSETEEIAVIRANHIRKWCPSVSIREVVE